VQLDPGWIPVFVVLILFPVFDFKIFHPFYPLLLLPMLLLLPHRLGLIPQTLKKRTPPAVLVVTLKMPEAHVTVYAVGPDS